MHINLSVKGCYVKYTLDDIELDSLRLFFDVNLSKAISIFFNDSSIVDFGIFT